MTDRLGFLLVRAGKISQEQLFDSLRQQRANGGTLGDILIQNGRLTESDIVEVVAAQNKIPFASDQRFTKLDPALAGVLERKVAETYRIVPLELRGEELVAAICEPATLGHIEEISYFAKRPVCVQFASAAAVDRGLASLYGVTITPGNRSSLSEFLTFCQSTSERRWRSHAKTPKPPVHLPSIAGFDVVDRISLGGMAEIFRGRHLSSGTDVAIKMLLPDHAANKTFSDMFIDEGNIASRLNHANICRVIQTSRARGGAYIAMEFIDGIDLRKLIGRRAAKSDVSPDLAAFLICRLASALGYAHQLSDGAGRPLGVIHRDVSPSNVLLGIDGRVTLIDFGIVKMYGRIARTQSGMLKGKLGYMSPEQLSSRELDHRCDQFALGTIFYELLAGRQLFQGATDIETMALQTRLKIPALPATVPRSLETIVRRALQKAPADRYPDCEVMGAELGAYLHRRPAMDFSSQISHWVRSARLSGAT